MKIKANKMWRPLLGMAVTAITGGLIGSFLGKWIYIIAMASVGALLGYAIWSMGGQRFFLFVMIGAFLGSTLATVLAGAQASLLGAATGGAMGGFLGVNFLLFKHKN